METIRVLIVDDHAMIRRGLRSLLSSFEDISVVGEADDGITAMEAAHDLSPDVILLDIQMKGPDGIAIAPQLVKAHPNSKIIILTAHDDDEYIQRALRAGAFAYVLKSSTDATVVEAIRQVHQGKRFLSPALVDRVLQQYQETLHSDVANEYGLTAEELRVLALIARGATTEDISKAMYCGERTIKRKVEGILAKMRVRSRSQAVAEAVKKGMI